MPLWSQPAAQEVHICVPGHLVAACFFPPTTEQVGLQWALRTMMYLALSVSGANVFAANNRNGIFLSIDNGITWSPTNFSWLMPTALSFALSSNGTGGTNVFAGTYGGGVYLSTDNGANWKVVSIDHASLDYLSLAVSGSNLLGGTDKGVFLSTNNGANWTPTNLTTSTDAFAISPNAPGDTILFAGTLSNGVWLSSDKGASWQPTAGNGLTSSSIWSIAVAPGAGGTIGTSLIAGTDSGVFLSTNYGTNWMRVNYGLMDVTIRACAISGTNLFVGTWGGGVWRRPLSNLTDVENLSADVPTHFILEQNYPNPFNPSTTIRYELPKSANVTLKIFNTLGQEIAVLVNERKEAGSYQVTWNGGQFPSAVYFYRLRAGSFIETRKLILQK